MQQPKKHQEGEKQPMLEPSIDLPMEVEVNRKRKILLNENNSVKTKKREIRTSKSRLFKNKSLIDDILALLSTRPPQIAQVETRKRKLDMRSDNESENEDLLKVELTKIYWYK